MKEKVITIFGSSLPIEGDEEFEIAYQLGKLCAKNNVTVCTGGNHGIMEAVSKGSVEHYGKAIGITVEPFNNPNKYLTEHIHCKNLFERIEKLVQIGDGFIVLNGGTGTLLELSVVWELLNKEFIAYKPVAAHGKLWKQIIDKMEIQIAKEKRISGLIKCFDNIDYCFEYVYQKIIELP